jgi:hypothetical protein
MKYTKEKLEEVAKESFSTSECLRKLGLKPVGGNFKTIKCNLKRFQIDTSHFTGQLWSKGKKLGVSNRAKPLDEILIENSTFFSSTALKNRLVREGVKTWLCEECNNTEWNNQKIPLELEHCNGNNLDHRIENLKLLCPNCHAQTKFYRGRNKRSAKNEARSSCLVEELEATLIKKPTVVKIKKKPIPRYKSCGCGAQILTTSTKCRECDYVDRKTKRPPLKQLIEDFQELKSFVQVGKKYNVSDNAVRKWLKVYQIEEDIKNFLT